ncbi:MAG: hypothetical protein ABWY25_02600 [Paenisporosarcina sp.]
MATDTDHKAPSKEEDKKAESKEYKISAEAESKFQFGPAPIQTPEDAAMAYLREEISEEDFRAACGKFGVLPGTLLKSVAPNERIDASFKRSIPDDIYNAPTVPDVSLDDKLKAVAEKEKAKEEATAADESSDVKTTNKDSIHKN